MTEYSAANRKDIRSAEKVQKAIEASRQSVLVGLMSTTEGRAYIWGDLEYCRVFEDPFSGEALAEAFTKGIRTVGLKKLTELMSYCPDQFILAMREANERRTASEFSRSQNGNGRDQGSESEPNLDSGGDLFGEDPHARIPEGTYTVRN